MFDRSVFPVIWLWLVYGGWRGYYQAIMEPWTGYPSALAEAVAGRTRALARRRARRLRPRSRQCCMAGCESVSRLAADGSVGS